MGVSGNAVISNQYHAAALLTLFFFSFNRNKLYKAGNFLLRSLLHIGRYEVVWICIFMSILKCSQGSKLIAATRG